MGELLSTIELISCNAAYSVASEGTLMASESATGINKDGAGGRAPEVISRADGLPARIEDVDELDAILAHPSPTLVDDLAAIEGDILILGVAGKMGPTLARLARNAAPEKRIIGVARFSDPSLQSSLQAHGVETVTADLLEPAQVERLPRARNVIFMAGRKFGSRDDQPLTWAMNVHVPAVIASTFRSSRIVSFSTGNVYPLINVLRQSATEQTPPGAIGEYAQSCLGRERMFEFFSAKYGTPGRIFRLNYAIDLRYGVLFDLANRIKIGEPVDVTTGHVNVIWQGDANAQALRCLRHCTVPCTPLNVSGPETLSVRYLANELGARLGKTPQIIGCEAETALLTNAAQAATLFGYPLVPLGTMLDWVSDWVSRDKANLGKPTKFEVRDGAF
jgi:nucleoside-diphosphate-sugar epimerase